MNSSNCQKLINKAREMALANIWEENAFRINMKILEVDSNNFAACTRLAKYYKLNDNLVDAKKMYLKALEIEPNSQGVKNNLIDIEKYQSDKLFVDQIATTRELYAAGLNLTQKGKLSLAVKCFLKAYNVEPLLDYAVGLARIYRKLGRHDKIEALYNELIANRSSKNTIDAVNNKFATLLQR